MILRENVEKDFEQVTINIPKPMYEIIYTLADKYKEENIKANSLYIQSDYFCSVLLNLIASGMTANNAEFNINLRKFRISDLVRKEECLLEENIENVFDKNNFPIYLLKGFYCAWRETLPDMPLREIELDQNTYLGNILTCDDFVEQLRFCLSRIQEDQLNDVYKKLHYETGLYLLRVIGNVYLLKLHNDEYEYCKLLDGIDIIMYEFIGYLVAICNRESDSQLYSKAQDITEYVNSVLDNIVR